MRTSLFIFLISSLLLVSGKSVRRRNVEEIGGYYQGDILLAPGQIGGRSGALSPNSRWPNKTIPYTIADDYCRYRIIRIPRSDQLLSIFSRCRKRLHKKRNGRDRRAHLH
jgi:hypothetical protein